MRPVPVSISIPSQIDYRIRTHIVCPVPVNPVPGPFVVIDLLAGRLLGFLFDSALLFFGGCGYCHTFLLFLLSWVSSSHILMGSGHYTGWAKQASKQASTHTCKQS
ncbi:hypothetical protein BKA81DRAFT_91343 [Phyllosticta paracitricarpa]